MSAPPGEVQRALETIEMDHSIPKFVICTQWKRAIHESKGSDIEFTFKSAVNIDFVNYLLFSVVPDPIWGPPLVQPRCYKGPGGANCHKQVAWEHCQSIGLFDFKQLSLNPPTPMIPAGPHDVDDFVGGIQDTADDVQIIEVIDLSSG